MNLRRWLGLCWACLATLALTACGSTTPAFDSIIINFVDSATPDQVEAIAARYHLPLELTSDSAYAHTEELYRFPFASTDRQSARRLIQSLDQEPLIEYAEPNYHYSISLDPNDPRYPEQWNLKAINMPKAWDVTAGQGVTVAVIDTGVTQVSDLAQTEFVKGYDFVDNDDDASDLHGHGTHVSGTVAQSTNNGEGVAGVAYQAKIMPVRVLDANGSGTADDVAEGIRWAADHGATVINMSLGSSGSSQVIESAVQHAYDKGVTIVAAAGNESSNQASFPARYPHVIGVSSFGPNGEKAPYSNYGVGVDIAAPGGAKTTDHPEWGILQQTINRRDPNQAEYAYFQGTSMAAPHVAGVAALIQAQGIQNPDEVEKALKQAAQPVENDKLNYFGSGRLNAEKAVAKATHQEDENPFVLWIKDFLYYLSSNGYLNPKFWLDGGAIALVPKLIMVLGGYIITVIIRWWLAPKRLGFSWPLATGVLLGSSGLFILNGIRVVDFPAWPLQILGSSVPEWGTAFSETGFLNPIFASVLIPLGLVLLFLGHRSLRWLAIGLSAGMAAQLLLSSTLFYEGVLWFGSSAWFGRSFLFLNGLFCLGLAYLASLSILSSPSFSGLATLGKKS